MTVTFAPRRATSHGGHSPRGPDERRQDAAAGIPLALAPVAGYFEPPAPPADGEEPEPPTREIAPVDWDDRMVVEVEATEEEDQGDANGEAGDGEGARANAEASDASAGTRLVSAESSLAPFRARKVKRPMPEPTHLIEDECAKTAALRVFAAVADDAKRLHERDRVQADGDVPGADALGGCQERLGGDVTVRMDGVRRRGRSGGPPRAPVAVRGIARDRFYFAWV